MTDIQREANLSAGAIYLYFKSKNDIILGIARNILGTIGDLIPEKPLFDGREVSLPEIVTGFLRMAEALNAESSVFPLALQVWAEAIRNRDVLHSLQTDIADVKRRIRGLIEVCQERGIVARDVDPDALVMAMLGLAQGYIIQRSLFEETGLEQYLAGVEALMLNAARTPVETPDTI
jgi:AcrR family transcriptional regulator